MRWLPLLLLAACTVERTALEITTTPLTTCDEAWTADTGAACDLERACSRALPDDPICCKELAVCADEVLVRDKTCDPGCTACDRDAQCPFGHAVCELHRCLACPDVGACRPCPDGWTLRQRNGCPTCDCVPKTQCDRTVGCGDGFCYRGEVCAPGCEGELSCCANVCGPREPRCVEPAPLGCNMRCPVELGCSRCVASPCECRDGKWRCKPVCAEIEATCVHID